MNGALDALGVIAAILAAGAYLSLRWWRARKRRQAGLCGGSGCACPVGKIGRAGR